MSAFEDSATLSKDPRGTYRLKITGAKGVERDVRKLSEAEEANMLLAGLNSVRSSQPTTGIGRFMAEADAAAKGGSMGGGAPYTPPSVSVPLPAGTTGVGAFLAQADAEQGFGGTEGIDPSLSPEQRRQPNNPGGEAVEGTLEDESTIRKPLPAPPSSGPRKKPVPVPAVAKRRVFTGKMANAAPTASASADIAQLLERMPALASDAEGRETALDVLSQKNPDMNRVALAELWDDAIAQTAESGDQNRLQIQHYVEDLKSQGKNKAECISDACAKYSDADAVYEIVSELFKTASRRTAEPAEDGSRWQVEGPAQTSVPSSTIPSATVDMPGSESSPDAFNQSVVPVPLMDSQSPHIPGVSQDTQKHPTKDTEIMGVKLDDLYAEYKKTALIDPPGQSKEDTDAVDEYINNHQEVYDQLLAKAQDLYDAGKRGQTLKAEMYDFVEQLLTPLCDSDQINASARGVDWDEVVETAMYDMDYKTSDHGDRSNAYAMKKKADASDQFEEKVRAMKPEERGDFLADDGPWQDVAQQLAGRSAFTLSDVYEARDQMLRLMDENYRFDDETRTSGKREVKAMATVRKAEGYTMQGIIQDAKQELEQRVRDMKPEDRAAFLEDPDYSGVLSEITDSSVPVYTSDLMDLGASDNNLATDTPELGPAFDGSPTPSNIIAANIYERVQQALYEYVEELKKSLPETGHFDDEKVESPVVDQAPGTPPGEHDWAFASRRGSRRKASNEPHITWLDNYLQRWDTAEEADDDDTMSRLSDELKAYCKNNGLPNRSADELRADLVAGEVRPKDTTASVRTAMTLTPEKMIALIESKYPDLQPAPSEDFNGMDGGIWFKGTESAEVNGMPIFNYYAEDNEEKFYVMHVEKGFRAFLEENGWFPEPNDPGTLMAFPIDSNELRFTPEVGEQTASVRVADGNWDSLAQQLQASSAEVCGLNNCTEDQHNCESYAYITADGQLLDICGSDFFQGSSDPVAAVPLPWQGSGQELQDEVAEQTFDETQPDPAEAQPAEAPAEQAPQVEDVDPNAPKAASRRKAAGQTLVERLQAAGLKVDHHASDLYVQDTPEAISIINQFQQEQNNYKNISRFIDNIDHEPWLEVSFAWDGPEMHPTMASQRTAAGQSTVILNKSDISDSGLSIGIWTSLGGNADGEDAEEIEVEVAESGPVVLKREDLTDYALNDLGIWEALDPFGQEDEITIRPVAQARPGKWDPKDLNLPGSVPNKESVSASVRTGAFQEGDKVFVFDDERREDVSGKVVSDDGQGTTVVKVDDDFGGATRPCQTGMVTMCGPEWGTSAQSSPREAEDMYGQGGDDSQSTVVCPFCNETGLMEANMRNVAEGYKWICPTCKMICPSINPSHRSQGGRRVGEKVKMNEERFSATDNATTEGFLYGDDAAMKDQMNLHVKKAERLKADIKKHLELAAAHEKAGNRKAMEQYDAAAHKMYLAWKTEQAVVAKLGQKRTARQKMASDTKPKMFFENRGASPDAKNPFRPLMPVRK